MPARAAAGGVASSTSRPQLPLRRHRTAGRARSPAPLRSESTSARTHSAARRRTPPRLERLARAIAIGLDDRGRPCRREKSGGYRRCSSRNQRSDEIDQALAAHFAPFVTSRPRRAARVKASSRFTSASGHTPAGIGDAVVVAPFVGGVRGRAPGGTLDEAELRHARQRAVHRADVGDGGLAARLDVLDDAVAVTLAAGEAEQDVELHSPQRQLVVEPAPFTIGSHRSPVPACRAEARRAVCERRRAARVYARHIACAAHIYAPRMHGRQAGTSPRCVRSCTRPRSPLCQTAHSCRPGNTLLPADSLTAKPDRTPDPST